MSSAAGGCGYQALANDSDYRGGVENIAKNLHELNPMMGQGMPMAVSYPEIAEMQTRACEAAINVNKKL